MRDAQPYKGGAAPRLAPGVSRRRAKLCWTMGAAAFPQAGAEEASARLEVAASKERMKERTPRVDWAELLKRTLDFDVFVCVRCGGRRWVLAYVKGGGGVRAILEHLGMARQVRGWPQREGPPRARGVEARVAPAKRAKPLPRTSWEGGLDRHVPQGAARLLHPPGALLGRPPSAALLGPCAPALPFNRSPFSLGSRGLPGQSCSCLRTRAPRGRPLRPLARAAHRLRPCAEASGNPR